MKHRTAMGKVIDMGTIRQKNEHVRAIGNMQVNARGDIIDSNNEVVSDANQRTNNAYDKTTMNPGSQAKSRPAPKKAPVPTTAPVTVPKEELSASELEFEDELDDEIVPPKDTK